MASSTSPVNQTISALFENPNGDSGNELAALINQEIGMESFKRSTASQLTILSSITQQLVDSSLAHRETIDDFVTFVSFASLQINSKPTPIGSIRKDDEPPLSKIAPLHPVSGPTIVGENLAEKISDTVRDATSRAVTPDDSRDRSLSKRYYRTVSVQTTILARAFALSESFRGPLWSVIEDILIKGLFSGDHQEPGAFIALAALMLGAGKEIKEYMDGGKKGQGKAWLWYDDVRTEAEAKWEWKDVVEAFKHQPGQGMNDRLPDYVKNTLELAQRYVEGGLIEESWDSERLAEEGFDWANVD